MKNILFKLKSYQIGIILLVLVGISVSCDSDFLDKRPLDELSSGSFWKTEKDINLALVGCYNCPLSRFQEHSFRADRGLLYLDLAAGLGTEKAGTAGSITDGTLSPTNSMIAKYWKNSYEEIFAYNTFLDNVVAAEVEMDVKEKDEMIAEVRTLRAFTLFNLALYYGNIPMPVKTLSISESMEITQTKQADVWAFAEKELIESYPKLPSHRPSTELGRITKGACLAALGRLQMAQKKWSEAVLTYKMIIDSKEYLIDDRFKELFWEEGENSTELIFSTHALAEVFVARKLLYVYPEMAGGWHQLAPFNEVADQYLCTDGLPIEESSLYDVNNPFENRDPRLYETLLIPGRSMFKGNLYTAHPNAESDKDKVSKQANIWTGYSIYKLADENYDGNLRTSGANTVVFRYAEVLLGYIESLLESGSALTQADLDLSINQLRLRAAVNMPIVTVTDNETLREVVRRERFCELAFEGVRYFDLLRWGLTDQYLNKQFHGMKLTNDPVAWNSDPESFGKVNDDGFLIHVKRNFVKGRNELWPIPQSELDINKNLKQNPGYN